MEVEKILTVWGGGMSGNRAEPITRVILRILTLKTKPVLSEKPECLVENRFTSALGIQILRKVPKTLTVKAWNFGERVQDSRQSLEELGKFGGPE